LCEAGADEHSFAVRGAADERGEREQDEPAEEDAAAAEEIGGAPAEQGEGRRM
jgi:hypothetical protein